MRNSRSFSGSNYRNNSSRSWSSNNRSGGGGRKQATFNPTELILKLGTQTVELQPQIQDDITNTFDELVSSEELKSNILKKGYQSPTPIQDQIIPHISSGRDVVGIANTGTGKTAAFLVPLIEKVLQSDTQKVLIIVPTRELAVQVADEVRSLSQNMGVYSTLCIGGASIGYQIDSLRRNPHFVIGTPGRLKDLSMKGKLQFHEFNSIVLDEVDRMLDMGFVHEVKAIISSLSQDRQSLFFSATMTRRVEEIMAGFLENPVRISVKSRDTSSQVKQDIIKLQGRSKMEVLEELLLTKEFEKVLVFGRTKRGAEKLMRDLVQKGFRVSAIHGNKTQSQRQRALKQFKDNHVQALIATDVVARGLDIANVTHVINFDLPESYEDYIHRIGRTGRANNLGIALTLI